MKAKHFLISITVMVLCLLSGIWKVSAYVCNTASISPLTVTMNQPEELKGYESLSAISTTLTNEGNLPLTVRLYYSALDTILFLQSKDKTNKTFTETITIPANSSKIHLVKIAAGQNTYTGHYPIRLDASYKKGDKTVHVNVVYPVQTVMPKRSNWKPVNDLVAVVNTPWDETRYPSPTGTETVFAINDKYKGEIAVVPGKYGLADGTVTVRYPDALILYKGIRVWIGGKPIYELSPGPLTDDGKNAFKQTVQYNGQTVTVFQRMEQRSGGVSFTIRCSDPTAITQMEFGPASSEATGLWFGHGWYVKKPGTLFLRSDGAGFSTSFAAYEYDNNLAVLMGSSFVIDHLQMDPKQKISTISTRAETTLSLVPRPMNAGGAMACAFCWRSLSDKVPGPGVKAKAGRYIVDIWNGRYADHSALIRQAAKYGLKNDVAFISHNWQRFRYDHRLPDVWPPNPLFGTKEEMYDALKAARENGWYFGTHNNVIDYYPDSTEFSYDNVAFLPNGTPQRAYRNVFLEAQSYRLAPHRAPEIIGKTLDEINADGFVQDLCFVDVLSSYVASVSKAYYDRHGNYYSPQKSVDETGNVFVTIAEKLNPALKKLAAKGDKNIIVPKQAFTVSESGHDLLTGKLDGADCQYVNLTKTSGEYHWLRIPEFADAERVPWFDAVNHQKIVLHGAGYSIRFESGRGRELHGLDSDDYISTEILTGHPLMADGFCRDVKEILSGYVRQLNMPKSLRQVVRKYYLAQGVARELADADIVSHEFIDGDIHRQKIVWSSGAIIHVNRGTTDWQVDDTILPQYGYLVRNQKTGLFSTICRINGRVVEMSSWKEDGKTIRYVNARNTQPDGMIPVSPVASVSEGKDNLLKLHVDWKPYQQKKISDEKFQISLYLVRRKGSETARGEDYLLKTVTRSLTQSLEVELPLQEKYQGTYDLLVAIVPEGKDIENVDHRQKLLATPSFFYRYHLGNVVFDNKGKYTFKRFEETDTALYERLFPPKEPVDFGYCQTKGGFRIETLPGQKEPKIIQLPNEEKTELTFKKR